MERRFEKVGFQVLIIASTVKDEGTALGRGLSLLRLLADAGEPLSNGELAKRAGIPKATVSRLTATLQSAGFLRLAPDERFALGPATLHLGNAFLRSFDFRQQARTHLAELADAAGANVHLGVREGLDILLIDTIRPRSALIVSRMDVGSRMAIATSAVGRAYFASLPPEQQAPLLEEIRAASGEAWPQLQSRLEAARAEYASSGFCSSFGEWHPDINAVGFSLLGPRGERYGVSVGGPAYTLKKEFMLEKVGPQLPRTKQAIEREAGLG